MVLDSSLIKSLEYQSQLEQIELSSKLTWTKTRSMKLSHYDIYPIFCWFEIFLCIFLITFLCRSLLTKLSLKSSVHHLIRQTDYSALSIVNALSYSHSEMREQSSYFKASVQSYQYLNWIWCLSVEIEACESRSNL